MHQTHFDLVAVLVEARGRALEHGDRTHLHKGVRPFQVQEELVQDS